MSLIELLVGSTIMLGVIAAALPVLERSVRTERSVRAAVLSVADARVFSEQVVRDLRLAYATPGFNPYAPDPDTFTVNTYVRHAFCGSNVLSGANTDPIQCRVTYSCSTQGTCTRQERDPDGTDGGSPVTMVTGLSDPNIFIFPTENLLDTTVTFVGVTVEFPNPTVPGDDAITLQDGTALRNLGTNPE